MVKWFMAAIKALDKPGAQVLQQQLEELLAPLGAMGVKAIFKRISPNPGGRSATFDVEFALLDSDGQAATLEADSFREHCARFGFAETDLGRQFREMGSNGKPKATVYRVAGLNLWAEQFPVLIERVDTGKTYKRTAHEVKLALQNGAIKMTPGQGCS